MNIGLLGLLGIPGMPQQVKRICYKINDDVYWFDRFAIVNYHIYDYI